MSIVSRQINQACSANHDLPMCKLLDTVAPIVFVLFAILGAAISPFLIYSVLNKKSYLGDWTQKLAYLSGLGCIDILFIGYSLQIFKFIPDSLPVLNYSIFCLVGIIPLFFKHPEVLASIYPNESKEISGWSQKEKSIAVFCVLALFISAIVIFINT